MITTARLLLQKPDPNPLTGDYLDVSVLNSNFDKIDAALGAEPVTSSTRPVGAAAWNGKFIRETDTGRLLVRDSSAWVTVYDPNTDSAWTQFFPTWSNSLTTQPVLGNGALIARYKKIGHTASFMLKLFWGTTTTGGDPAGFWSFGGFPASLDRVTSELFFDGGAWDSSAVNLHEVTAQVSATTGATFINRLYTRASAGALQRMGTAAPFTWASGDILQISGTLETVS